MRHITALTCLALTLAVAPCGAQQPVQGVELRGYPAGLIGVLRADWPVAPRMVVTTAVGYNATNRRSWGEHDHESGGGPGLGVGLDRTTVANQLGWRLGARADLWTLGINWRDDGGMRGTTRVWVFQPTGHLAYAWRVGTAGWRVEASAALGAEINIRTRGQAVGQGAIALLGLALLGHL